VAHLLRHWNGLSIPRNSSTVPPTQITIQTDASGSWGCGAIHGCLWLQLRWSDEWLYQDIMAKELVPVALMMAVWGALLAKQNVLLQCDNLSLVTSINKGTAKPPLVMHLLCSLWFFTAHYDTVLTVTHVLGVTNTAADQLSTLFISPSKSYSIQATNTHPTITTENYFSAGTILDLTKLFKNT